MIVPLLTITSRYPELPTCHNIIMTSIFIVLNFPGSTNSITLENTNYCF